MWTVLISGAGVAGPTLAYWLVRAGFRPTVVERATGQRSSGSPVDVRGPALPVVERMGVVDALRVAATQATGIRFVDSSGRLSRRMSRPSRRSAAGTPEIEVPRADLARVLCAAAGDDAEFVYDDTITRLDQDPGGVDVTFESGPARRFGLVVGADGLHSAVRLLAFGPERDFVRHLGVYVATTPLGEPPEEPHDVLLHNTPGRLVAIHPVRGEAGVAFIFRHPAVPGFDHRDLAQHRRILAGAYAGERGWRVPELLPGRCGSTTSTSTRSAGWCCRPGRSGGWCCWVMRRPRSRCSATVRAWLSPAPVRWPPLSPTATMPPPSGATRPSTDAAPMPGGAAPVSWQRC